MNKFAVASFILLAASCGDKDKDTLTPPLSGGKGGNAVLKVYPQHHGIPIDSCTVYVKYATNEMPTGGYDDSARCQVIGGASVATLSGLKTGSYYLFGFGYDPAYAMDVDGGLPYNISQEDTLTVVLSVNE